jgi:hypothetical protein
MKRIVFSLLFITCTGVLAQTPKIECFQELQRRGFKQERSYQWVCKSANLYTLDVLNWTLERFRVIDSLSFISGGTPTSWTIPCLNIARYNLGYKRSDSLGMLCRSITEQEFKDLNSAIEYYDISGYTAHKLARLFSPRSLNSFIDACTEIYGDDFCEIYK